MTIQTTRKSFLLSFFYTMLSTLLLARSASSFLLRPNLNLNLSNLPQNVHSNLLLKQTKITLPIRSFSSLLSSQSEPQPTYLTSTTYSSSTLLPSTIKFSLSKMKIDSMTEIQSKTLHHALESQLDCIGRARTGTGKTLAFLVPAITTLINNRKNALASRNLSDNSRLGVNSKVGILIVSPTRELASQINDQAGMLIANNPEISTQVVFGGTSLNADITKIGKKVPRILVATPGRLLDLLENGKINNGGGQGYTMFKDMVKHLDVLVLDEADRLLDMGFSKEILKISAFLPKTKQTLLFSATMPASLRPIMESTLLPGYKVIDCINDGDAATVTNSKVKQSYAVVGDDRKVIDGMISTILHVLADDTADKKVVIFFNTARMTGLMAESFTILKKAGFIQGNVPTFEIHSRKSQSARTKQSDAFRSSKTGILFTSDVSARGVDYPDVTHVLQFGIADSRESYIHRLGRTGRAGKDGEGWLVLGGWENGFIRELGDGVDISVNSNLDKVINNKEEDFKVSKAMDALRNRCATDPDYRNSVTSAYQAVLGFYNGNCKRLGSTGRGVAKGQMVSFANRFISSLWGPGLPPGISTKVVGKMGLKGVEGVNSVKESGDGGGGQRSSGSRGGGGGGGGRGGFGSPAKGAWVQRGDNSNQRGGNGGRESSEGGGGGGHFQRGGRRV